MKRIGELVGLCGVLGMLCAVSVWAADKSGCMTGASGDTCGTGCAAVPADASMAPSQAAAPAEAVAETAAVAEAAVPVKASALSVDMKLGTGVVDRELTGESAVFSAAETSKIYCWSRVSGASEPTTVVHKWYFGDSLVSEVTLNITYPSHRTWSSKTLDPAMTGAWKVEVVDSAGALLGVKTFSLEQQQPAAEPAATQPAVEPVTE